MNNIMDPILRTIFSFVLLLIMANKLGKVVNAKGTYYSSVFYITIGSVAANLGFNVHINVWNIFISFLSFSCIAYILAYVSTKNRNIRRWISGHPIVIIENGKIIEENMKKLNFTLDMLHQSLREKDVFEMNEIEYAVFENSGNISILKKEPFRSPTKKDFEMVAGTKSKLPLELIMDGVFINENLQSPPYNKEWLLQELKERKLSVTNVHYGIISSTGDLFFVSKKKTN